MSPPTRAPSLPRALHRAFKPPGPARSTSGQGSDPATFVSRSSAFTKPKRDVSDADRMTPAMRATSSVMTNNASISKNGVPSVNDDGLEDINMEDFDDDLISSDDEMSKEAPSRVPATIASANDTTALISSDDDEDVFPGMSTATSKRPAVTALANDTAEGANAHAAAANKPSVPSRPSRLPSLSPDSDRSPTRGPSPTRNDGTAGTNQIGGPRDTVPLLPGPLITRLLHESFRDKQLKIGKDANSLMARYLDVFVREAVARSALAQKERKMAENAGVHEGDVWLDQVDLEEVALGLVLDF